MQKCTSNYRTWRIPIKRFSRCIALKKAFCHSATQFQQVEYFSIILLKNMLATALQSAIMLVFNFNSQYVHRMYRNSSYLTSNFQFYPIVAHIQNTSAPCIFMVFTLTFLLLVISTWLQPPTMHRKLLHVCVNINLVKY